MVFTVLCVLFIAFLPWIIQVAWNIGDIVFDAFYSFIEGWKDFIKFVFGKGES